MKKRLQPVLFIFLAGALLPAHARAATVGCATAECHQGLMSIVPEELPMMQMIKMAGQQHGDPDGCVVCHGGNPKAKEKKAAHQGIPASLRQAPGPKGFYPDPGSIWISDRSCGQCHPRYTYRAKLSLMNTEAGKVQGNLHTWGLEEVTHQKVPWGNYDVSDEDGPVPMTASSSATYRDYMRTMKSLFPNQFPSQLQQVPEPDLARIKDDAKLAGLTYQRQECQRCHLGVRGREKRGYSPLEK